ncbi:transglycosylase SLT domain-containing protein [Rhodobacterales bacterium HKCCE2091]|nr:transglycosylase SLT domain-containing protein [Rhodobacterales bacterium HKCCE2091]
MAGALLAFWFVLPAAADEVVPVARPAAAPAAATDIETGPATGPATGGPAGAGGVGEAAMAAHMTLAPILPPGLDRSLRPEPRDTWAMPAMAWDGAPDAGSWSAAVMAALRGPGRPLVEVVPRDIGAWCPAYRDADTPQRAAFWAGLVSTLAWYESTHDERAVGGGGLWYGLVQIAPATARGYGCAVGTGSALLDGEANLRCGLRIMGHTVPRDGVVAEGMEGVAADWGPFHSARKREGMRHWLLRQSYCVPGDRPVARPSGPAGTARPTPGPRPAMRPGAAVGVVEEAALAP